MRLTLVVLLVVGTAAVLVSSQQQDRRQQARARFRVLAEQAKRGDKEAQEILQARRRQRQRNRPSGTRSSAVPPRPVFADAVEEPASRAPKRVRVPIRRNRVRPEITTFHPTTTLATTTPAPETVFPVETTFAIEDATQATIFEEAPQESFQTREPIRLFNNFREETPAPRQRFRPANNFNEAARQRDRPADDFSINFDIEPHRALNSGLEVDTRSEHIIPRFDNDRTTEAPVETIRRYSYFDEQGNYVFGYEAADGSFKEEVRGLDCVVNGKYGYVDPEGVRREFTYTSGNKCDPNAVVDPETQEIPVLPLNDQFLQQTNERQLTQEELEQIQFNRRRRPVQTARPEVQTVVTSRPARRRRPQPRPAARPTSRPIQEPEPVFQQATEAPIAATPKPAPRFTTPSSFSRFTTPPSLRPVQERFPVQEPEVRQPTPAPVQEQRIPQRTHQAFQPPEGPSLRPTPKPIAFDFDTEFNNLFQNFAGPRPATRAPVFRPTTQRPRPPTTRPPPPPTRPTTARPVFKPVTSAPVTRRPSLDDGSQTLSGGSDVANQLVFDAASGTFKTVQVKTATTNQFLPRPAPNPFAPRPVAPPTTLATRPPTPQPHFTPSAPTRPSTVGVPLPPPTQPAAFNPASHFVINQNGRSPAAAEFDKFFSQFNLKF